MNKEVKIKDMLEMGSTWMTFNHHAQKDFPLREVVAIETYGVRLRVINEPEAPLHFVYFPKEDDIILESLDSFSVKVLGKKFLTYRKV